MVLAVFLGSRPSGGFGVQITGVRSEGNGSSCNGPKRRPRPGMSAAAVMTAPSHIVAVPRHDGAVRFEKVER